MGAMRATQRPEPKKMGENVQNRKSTTERQGQVEWSRSQREDECIHLAWMHVGWCTSLVAYLRMRDLMRRLVCFLSPRYGKNIFSGAFTNKQAGSCIRCSRQTAFLCIPSVLSALFDVGSLVGLTPSLGVHHRWVLVIKRVEEQQQWEQR